MSGDGRIGSCFSERIPGAGAGCQLEWGHAGNHLNGTFEWEPKKCGHTWCDFECRAPEKEPGLRLNDVPSFGHSVDEAVRRAENRCKSHFQGYQCQHEQRLCNDFHYNGLIGNWTVTDDVASKYVPVDTEAEGKKNDPVHHPKHYTSHPSGVECITVTEHMGFCVGNAVKYLWRCEEKGAPIEDLQKAIWYIQREIARRTKIDHLEGCGRDRRGCVPGCENYDPEFDGPPEKK